MKIGYLRSYCGQEFHLELAELSADHPDVQVKIEYGNHEELYGLLKTGVADLVLNDQRRAFSDEYINLILTQRNGYIEISSRNPIALLTSITPKELKNIPCIFVAARDQRENELEYYRDVIGFQSEYLFAENLEEACLMIIGGQGFLPVKGTRQGENFGSSISRISLYRGAAPVTRIASPSTRQAVRGQLIKLPMQQSF